MQNYKFYFKDTDPDTGEISQEKTIAYLYCERTAAEFIKWAIEKYDEEPNREYICEKIKEDEK